MGVGEAQLNNVNFGLPTAMGAWYMMDPMVRGSILRPGVTSRTRTVGMGIGCTCTGCTGITGTAAGLGIGLIGLAGWEILTLGREGDAPILPGFGTWMVGEAAPTGTKAPHANPAVKRSNVKERRNFCMGITSFLYYKHFLQKTKLGIL